MLMSVEMAPQTEARDSVPAEMSQVHSLGAGNSRGCGPETNSLLWGSALLHAVQEVGMSSAERGSICGAMLMDFWLSGAWSRASRKSCKLSRLQGNAPKRVKVENDDNLLFGSQGREHSSNFS